MKRLLYISLGALVISATTQAREWDYFAVFKNPISLSPKEKQDLPVGAEYRIPAFATAQGVKVGQKRENKIIYSTIDLMAASKLPETTDYSITQLPAMMAGEVVFQICIKKTLLPHFNPQQSEKTARFGFKNVAKVEDKGTMWCFTLKNNQGYSKLLIDR